MKRRLEIGDVVEMRTTRGVAYVQLVHRHSKWGTLIRVLPGVFDSQPSDLDQLVAGHHQFMAFFLLPMALTEGLARLVGPFPVPSTSVQFPLFRAPLRDFRTSKVRVWWLWDGEKEWPIGKLRREHRHLPLREIISYPVLVDRIESGWTPEAQT